ncbi:DNA polymerase III subunit gamma/tau [Anaerovorax odorimutans]|uniref:DNA polymerase III subunit gamma/tau n=1 Tax=Anaerovorax odorimutans TaxID=109327 RepID=UPI00040E17F0|nr:DNA polymerase III subunit gamma/tau [Anaerovorax odorimutans]
MYTALYRSFRPEVFDEILGQEHIVKILKNQIKTGTTSHAYLFCGTRGTGKTSTARILAKALNCVSEDPQKPCGKCSNCISIKEGTFMDVVEIDAASNNGVDNIRELRESVKYPPVIGRFKVYIIDEVHMLSTGAFNALLKTLEEPPEYVMFILATTEPQKLPATILSRCLRLDFKRVAESILKEGMKKICKQMDVEISESALGLIAANADGSVRDGLSILDQCISSGENSISREDVLELLGTSGEEVFIEITDYVKNHNVSDAILLLNKILEEGKDVRQFMKDWVEHFRSLLMTKFIKNPEDLLNMSCENVDRIRNQSEQLDLEVINDSIIELSKTLSDAKWSTQPRILLELCIVRLATGGLVKSSFQNKQKTLEPAITYEQNKVNNKDIKTKTEEKVKTQQKSSSEAVKENIDKSKLWHIIFEEGETQKCSFNLIRTGTVLKEVLENTFVVEVSNELTMKFVKENASTLESLMQKHLGRPLKLECYTAGEVQSKSQEKIAEDLAESIGNRLGISIEIE